MKKLLSLSIFVLFLSCNNGADKEQVRSNSETWVGENVFPLYDSPQIVAMMNEEYKKLKFNEDSLIAWHGEVTWQINLFNDKRGSTVALDPTDSVQVAEARYKRRSFGKSAAILETYKSALDTVLYNNIKDFYMYQIQLAGDQGKENVTIKILLDKNLNVLNPTLKMDSIR